MNLSDKRGKNQDGDVRATIYRIIRIGYTGDVPSRVFDIVIAAAILLNLFIIFFETFEESARYIPTLNVIELVTVVIFTIEYILRLAVADYAFPGRKSLAAAMAAFALSLYGIIDLLSFLPYWMSMFFPAAAIPVGGVVAFRMLRVVRILRLFRINRYYDAFNVITDVIKDKKNQILSALFIILMLVMGASIIMYNLEHNAQPEAFKNAFSGIWWAVSTLLTVGYGDIYPVTAAGRFVGIILAFLGVGIVAIPTGIISAGFVQQYTKIKDLAGISDEYPVGFFTLSVTKDHSWCGVKISDVPMAEGALIIGIIRGGIIVEPSAETVLLENDRVIVSSLSVEDEDLSVEEVMINEKSEWVGQSIREFSARYNVTCLVIKRENDTIVCNGDTVILNGDALIVSRRIVGGKM